MALYLVLGTAGVPIFAHGQAGLGALFGPTGGYIFGFVLGAGLGALTRRATRPYLPQPVADVSAAIVVVAGIYVAGWAWLAFGPAHIVVPKVAPPLAAFVYGVVPFLIPDAIKAVVAVAVATAVRRATSIS
jgi:biotin transport system substrate-specific component